MTRCHAFPSQQRCRYNQDSKLKEFIHTSFTKAYKKTNGSNFISNLSCKKMEIAAYLILALALPSHTWAWTTGRTDVRPPAAAPLAASSVQASTGPRLVPVLAGSLRPCDRCPPPPGGAAEMRENPTEQVASRHATAENEPVASLPSPSLSSRMVSTPSAAAAVTSPTARPQIRRRGGLLSHPGGLAGVALQRRLGTTYPGGSCGNQEGRPAPVTLPTNGPES